jgi:ABC-2 type transport system permease protein
MSLPKHPLDLLASLACASFAFIGIGLIIACVANSIGSVQAFGQSLFLPMILIGGVGVPLYALPEWAKPISLFLPGRYSVDAIHNSFMEDGGVFRYPVDLIALLVIGAAAMIVGWKLFRWEPSQRLERAAPIWIILAGLTWVAIGIIVIHWNWAPAR